MKRFTETDKWRDPWFRKLSPAAKLLWQWLLDNCDHAGVIDPDWSLAEFQIGEEIATAFEEMGERVRTLEGGKLWVPKFIEFQYGELSEECRAHGPVFRSLEKHGLKHRVLEGYPMGSNTHKDKDKDKDKEKDKDKDPPKTKRVPPSRGPVLSAMIEQIYDAYPVKKGKANAVKAIQRDLKAGHDATKILEAVEAFASADCPKPHASTYFNQRRWQDEDNGKDYSGGEFAKRQNGHTARANPPKCTDTPEQAAKRVAEMEKAYAIEEQRRKQKC